MPDNAVSLEAVANPISYNLTYDLGGGNVSPSNPDTYTVEDSDITLNNPVKTGYTFTGWSGAGITGSSDSVTIPQGSTGDRSYAAMWSANTYSVRVDYDTNGGSANPQSETGSVTYPDTDITLQLNASDPTRTGWTFAGWFTEQTGGTRVDGSYSFPSKNVDHDQSVTLYAH